MNSTLLSLPCFEPAGTSLDLSREDLLGHSLAIGSTGSGKTTRFVYPLIDQLIRQSESNIGLCIFDSKADGAMRNLVVRSCEESGRRGDLSIIDANSGAYIDCFSELEQIDIESADALAGLIGSGIPKDERNRYWDTTFQALLRQALRLHVLNPEAETGYSGLLKDMMRYLLKHHLKDPLYAKLVDHLKEQPTSDDAVAGSIIDEISATHRMWDILDFRTRSNLQSMTAALVGPMNTPRAHSMFEGKDPVNVGESMDAGRILLVSIDAVRHPEAARFVGIVLKGLFYDSVLSSKSDSMKGLILDDWPLCVTSGFGNRYSDIEALSMIRGAGGFVVAATQSLAALDVTIGAGSRAAAIANFANLAFFRCRDPLVDDMAATYLGQKSDTLTDYTRNDRVNKAGRKEPALRIEREIRVPSVPPGALARLPSGEAYALIGSTVYSHPLCLVPTYSKPQRKENNHEHRDL
jgi:hypothetical protein